MGFLESFGRQIGSAWTKLSPGYRVILLLLCAICTAVLVAVISWAGKPDYEILCTNLTAQDCAEIISGLKGQGIEARVAEGGSAVLVPSGTMDQARMVTAETGIPNSSRWGFEAFHEPKIGVTPFAEHINYLSALQNELATTVASLDSVAYARVHLVIPERKLFARESASGSASVLVVTRGDRPLSQGHATAVANLVASAVEGLSPDDVTITDGRGNVVTGHGEAGAEMAADGQWGYRQKVEQYLSEKAESMLARVLGFGRCEVRVTADMTFQDSRETTREYDPKKRVAVSERIETSKSSGASMEVGGVVGAGGSAGQGAAGATGGPAGNTQTENVEDFQYVVSESVKETVNRGADIKRLTVAAFVDLSEPAAEGATEGEEAAAAGGAAAAPTLEEVTRIISEAVGLDESRGDTLEIVQARFSQAPAEAAAGASRGLPPWATDLGQYFAIGAVAVVLALIAKRAFKGFESGASPPLVVPEIMAGEGGGRYLASSGQDELVRRELSRFVGDNPEVAGRMIEGWVQGEE